MSLTTRVSSLLEAGPLPGRLGLETLSFRVVVVWECTLDLFSSIENYLLQT